MVRQSPVNDVVSGYDPEAQWRDMLDQLSPSLNLIRYDGSLLQVRRIEKRPLISSVAYLPLKKKRQTTCCLSSSPASCSPTPLHVSFYYAIRLLLPRSGRSGGNGPNAAHAGESPSARA